MPGTAVTDPALLRAVRAAACAGVPVLLWGEPGIGKTAVVEALARADEAPLEVVVGSLREPSDLNGLPVVTDDGGVVLAPPAWARRLVAAGRGWLFLDELSTSPPAVQAAMLRVVKEGWVGDLRLPAEVVRIAAANDLRTAADGWQLAPATANRFCHLDVAADVGSWLSGMTVGWEAAAPDPGPRLLLDADAAAVRDRAVRARVAAFVRHRPGLLHAVPDDAVAAAGPWPSPRTWEHLAAALAHLDDADLDAARLLAGGLVGDGAALELLTWWQHDDLPDPEALLADPTLLDVDDRDDRLYAALGGVVAHAAALVGRDDAGTGATEAWTAAAEVLRVAAEGRRGDLAAPFVTDLLRVRPAGATVPVQLVTAFRPLLSAAGLV